jgi:hypothetical protein
LVGVAHHEKVVIAIEEALEDLPLERVDVLELVDEDVCPPPTLTGCETAVRRKRLGVAYEQIVEVDQPAAALLVLIAGVQRGDGVWICRQLPVGFLSCSDEVVRGDETCLGPLDGGCEVRGTGAFEARAATGQLSEEAHLALEERGFGRAPVRPPAPQLVEREGVESPGVHRAG